MFYRVALQLLWSLRAHYTKLCKTKSILLSIQWFNVSDSRMINNSVSTIVIKARFFIEDVLNISSLWWLVNHIVGWVNMSVVDISILLFKQLSYPTIHREWYAKICWRSLKRGKLYQGFLINEVEHYFKVEKIRKLWPVL